MAPPSGGASSRAGGSACTNSVELTPRTVEPITIERYNRPDGGAPATQHQSGTEESFSGAWFRWFAHARTRAGRPRGDVVARSGGRAAGPGASGFGAARADRSDGGGP